MSLSQQSFAFPEVAVVPIPLSPTSSCGPVAYTVSQQLFAFPKIEVVDSPCSRCRRCFSVAVHASSAFFSFDADCLASLPGAPVSRQNFVFFHPKMNPDKLLVQFFYSRISSIFKDFSDSIYFQGFLIYLSTTKQKEKKKIKIGFHPTFPQLTLNCRCPDSTVWSPPT